MSQSITIPQILMAGKAKVLSDAQVKAALSYLRDHTRYPEKNQVLFLLSVKAGLRAKEIAGLRWTMVTDPEGNLADGLTLPKHIVKGEKKSRFVPFNGQLKAALAGLLAQKRSFDPNAYVITSERGGAMSPATVANWFYYLYRKLGFEGCSSHSGRRTFITKTARVISRAGGSLRDVQELAGHSRIGTTQGYIEGSSEAQRKAVDLI